MSFGTIYEVSNFGIIENEHKYEQNIFYLYLSPFIGAYKIISKYILTKFQYFYKQTYGFLFLIMKQSFNIIYIQLRLNLLMIFLIAI